MNHASSLGNGGAGCARGIITNYARYIYDGLLLRLFVGWIYCRDGREQSFSYCNGPEADDGHACARVRGQFSRYTFRHLRATMLIG